MAKDLETEPRNASEVDTAFEVKKLFATVLQPGEKIKVFAGQRVVLNESSVGKPRDSLSPEALNQITKSALNLDEERVEIPTTEKGTRAPEFEVLAIGEKGPDGKAPTRTLFRQERGKELPTSVNLVGDLLANLIADAQMEGQQNGFTTYVNAHETIDRDENPFSPDLEGYSEDVRENPYLKGFTLEAYKEGFALGQETGGEAFPEIAVLKTEVDKASTLEESTAELIKEDKEEWSPSDDAGRDNARYYGDTGLSDEQEEQVFEEQIFDEETLAYFDSEAEQWWEDGISDRLWDIYHEGLTEGRGKQALAEAQETVAFEREQWRLVEEWGEDGNRDFPSEFLDEIEREEEDWRFSQLSPGRRQIESSVSWQEFSSLQNEQRNTVDEQPAPKYIEVSDGSTQPEGAQTYPFGDIGEVTEALGNGTFWDKLQNEDAVSETEQTSYGSAVSRGDATLDSSELGQEEYDENDYLEGNRAGEADRQQDEAAGNIQTPQSLGSNPALEGRSESFTSGYGESYFGNEDDFVPTPLVSASDSGDRTSDYEDAFTSSNRLDTAEEAISDKSPQAGEDIDQSAGASTQKSNTIAALLQSIEQLPEDSPARHIAEKIAADIQTRESEVTEREEKAQTFRNSVKTGLSSLKGLANSVRESAAEAIDTVRHPSLRGIAGFALKTAGQATRASGRALKATGQYLQTRAEKLDEYGMAKAAVAIHEKGHSRTGEDSFSKDGYTVEKSGNQYTVLNSENQSVMEFKTNRKGQPIRVVQTESAQPQDKKTLKKIARSPVILGSPEKEQDYKRSITDSAKTAIGELRIGQHIYGENFNVLNESKEVTVETVTFPSRRAVIDRESGELKESNLTKTDTDRFCEAVSREQDYRHSIVNSARTASKELRIGQHIYGENFNVLNESKEVTVETVTFPSRRAVIDRESGELKESNLTKTDIDRFSEAVSMAATVAARERDQVTI